MSKVEDIFQAIADEIGVKQEELSGITQAYSGGDHPYCKVETRSYGDFLIAGDRYMRMMETVRKKEEGNLKELVATLRFASGAITEIRGSQASRVREIVEKVGERGWRKVSGRNINFANVESADFEYK